MLLHAWTQIVISKQIWVHGYMGQPNGPANKHFIMLQTFATFTGPRCHVLSLSADKISYNPRQNAHRCADTFLSTNKTAPEQPVDVIRRRFVGQPG